MSKENHDLSRTTIGEFFNRIASVWDKRTLGKKSLEADADAQRVQARLHEEEERPGVKILAMSQAPSMMKPIPAN